MDLGGAGMEEDRAGPRECVGLVLLFAWQDFIHEGTPGFHLQCHRSGLILDRHARGVQVEVDLLFELAVEFGIGGVFLWRRRGAISRVCRADRRRGPAPWRQDRSSRRDPGQIVQFAGAVFVMLDEFPVPLADRARRPAALIHVVRLMPVQRPRRRRLALQQQVGEISAVEFLRAADVRRRPSSVGVQSVLIIGTSIVCSPLILPGQRTISGTRDASFVEKTLAGAIRAVVRCRRERRFQDVQPAVVRREDDDRILRQAQGVELRQDPAHAIVERFDHRGIGRIERVLVLGDQFLLGD